MELEEVIITYSKSIVKNNPMLWILGKYKNVFLHDIVMFVAIILLGIMLLYLYQKYIIQKKLVNQAMIEKQRYLIVSELTDDILFEYSIQEDVMRYAAKYKNTFGRNPVLYHYTEELVDEENVHRKDREIFRNYCEQLHIGKSIIDAEYRIMDRCGDYIWCHIKGKTTYNKHNRPCTVVGRIINTDTQKKKLANLEFKAQRDSLTRAYNKGTTKELIEEVLMESSEKRKHALFVIDVDDFKHVNDNYGHLFGDQVLSNITAHMRNMFRESDVVGRIGGDEFLVFIQDILSVEQVERKAEEMTKIFMSPYLYAGNEVYVSGSIGISLYPFDGLEYDELVEIADQALYEVKRKGKNSFHLYGKGKNY